jgi:hypothetical protein
MIAYVLWREKSLTRLYTDMNIEGLYENKSVALSDCEKLNSNNQDENTSYWVDSLSRSIDTREK